MQTTEVIHTIKQSISDDMYTFYDVQYAVLEKFEQEKDYNKKKQLKDLVDLFDRLQAIMIELNYFRNKSMLRGEY